MIYFLGDYFAACPRNLTCLQQPDFELIACARAALTTGVFSSCIELLPRVFAELILVPNYFLVLFVLHLHSGGDNLGAGDTLTHHHNIASILSYLFDFLTGFSLLLFFSDNFHFSA